MLHEHLIAAATARDVRIDDLSVDVHGTLAAAPPHFESIALEVRGRSGDEATFDKLMQIAERGCIVHNTLAGDVRVEVKRM
jgi:putative redox protein